MKFHVSEDAFSSVEVVDLLSILRQNIGRTFVGDPAGVGRNLARLGTRCGPSLGAASARSLRLPAWSNSGPMFSECRPTSPDFHQFCASSGGFLALCTRRMCVGLGDFGRSNASRPTRRQGHLGQNRTMPTRERLLADVA